MTVETRSVDKQLEQKTMNYTHCSVEEQGLGLRQVAGDEDLAERLAQPPEARFVGVGTCQVSCSHTHTAKHNDII